MNLGNNSEILWHLKYSLFPAPHPLTSPCSDTGFVLGTRGQEDEDPSTPAPRQVLSISYTLPTILLQRLNCRQGCKLGRSSPHRPFSEAGWSTVSTAGWEYRGVRCPCFSMEQKLHVRRGEPRPVATAPTQHSAHKTSRVPSSQLQVNGQTIKHTAQKLSPKDLTLFRRTWGKFKLKGGLENSTNLVVNN